MVNIYVNAFLKTQTRIRGDRQCVVFLTFFFLIIYLADRCIAVPRELLHSFYDCTVL